MDLQQKFGQRLSNLLVEKHISQGDFADQVNCSRQSINFYILGKRSPDITLAAKMAEVLGVSCDFLIGSSDFRSDEEANFTVNQIGLNEESMKFFAGLKIMAMGMAQENKDESQNSETHNDLQSMPELIEHAQKTLDLLNRLISHDQFGVMLGYIRRFYDICHGKDELAILNNFMLEQQSPLTGKKYGSHEENLQLMQDFCLHIANKYFDDIVVDICR